MAAHVLVQGTLFRSPEERTGKASGKSFVAATIKVRDGEAAQFWRVLAFSAEAQSALMRLDDGDALAVQGGLRAEAYQKDGEPRVGLTVVADCGVRRGRASRRAKSGKWCRLRHLMTRFLRFDAAARAVARGLVWRARHGWVRQAGWGGLRFGGGGFAEVW